MKCLWRVLLLAAHAFALDTQFDTVSSVFVRFETGLNATLRLPANPQALAKMTSTLKGLIERTRDEVDKKEAEVYEETLARTLKLDELKSDVASLSEDLARENSRFSEAKGNAESATQAIQRAENERADIEAECADQQKRDDEELAELNKHMAFMKSIAVSVSRSCDSKSFLQITSKVKNYSTVRQCTDGAITLETPMGKASNAFIQSATDPNYGARKTKCTLSRKSCAQTVDLAHSLMGEVKDSRDALEAAMVRERARCDKLLKRTNARMQDAIDTKMAAQTAEAAAMAELATINGQFFKRRAEERQEQRQLDDMQESSKAKLEDMKFTRTCGYRRARKQLAEAQSQDALPQDCEVGEWVSSGCSRECGGGQEILKREVLISSANGGVGCPKLKWKRKCNLDPCQVECKVGPWTDWSSCTTDCGGGTKRRTRDLIRPALHGAPPCTTTSATLCNTGSCSRDCVLHRWTNWSACSRACGGGSQVQRRRVKKKAMGHGSCPKRHNVHRFRSRKCNVDPCPQTVSGESAEALKCAADYDVVLVVDASGSWGTAESFADVKKVAQRLSTQFKDPVSVIQFSEMAKTLASADDLSFEGGGTRISRGLVAAKDRLMNTGRENVPTLLFLITDGGTSSFQFEVNKIASEMSRTGTRMLLLAPYGGDHQLRRPNNKKLRKLSHTMRVEQADVLVFPVAEAAQEAVLSSCQHVEAVV